MPDLGWDGLAIVTLAGINGFVLTSFWVIGYQLGDASLVGWLEYVQIPISFIYQTFVFGDVPNKYEVIGAVAVGVGGLLPTLEQLYIYMNEGKKGAKVEESRLDSDGGKKYSRKGELVSDSSDSSDEDNVAPILY